jgi:hypothetical protein
MALKLLQTSPFLHSRNPFPPSSVDFSLKAHTNSFPANQFRSHSTVTKVSASLIESPVLWIGKLCVQYALIKAGFAGSEENPLISSEFDETPGTVRLFYPSFAFLVKLI